MVSSTMTLVAGMPNPEITAKVHYKELYRLRKTGFIAGLLRWNAIDLIAAHGVYTIIYHLVH